MCPFPLFLQVLSGRIPTTNAASTNIERGPIARFWFGLHLVRWPWSLDQRRHWSS